MHGALRRDRGTSEIPIAAVPRVCMPAVSEALIRTGGVLPQSVRLAAAERDLAALCAQLKSHPGPFTRDEIRSLSFSTFEKLKWTWQALQLARLAVFGEAEHLFAAGAHSERGTFVVANEESLSFFHDEDVAFDAAAEVTRRLIGPLGCVAHVRTGEPLPINRAHSESVETTDILEQLPQLHEVYGDRSRAFPGEDVLPCMDVLCLHV